ncbi:hypothetical protein PtA15_13A327 [Puccinia triticina]|uniref:Thiamine pyrophosphate enzyme central domain-containing protein n=1 Tax=Puccinia triticina TaxID=208348 RepID=A0ABY7D7M7_9BASI|nr:uncharacterized protein PtA15_13A327 [Puccinia triticina]WAQ90927.1 hypothetical protein PtA15_13A327 [Puccinia triticina]
MQNRQPHNSPVVDYQNHRQGKPLPTLLTQHTSTLRGILPTLPGAVTVTAFPVSKARMHYKEDRRPTIPELLKDKLLLDLLAPAEARLHANPGGVSKPPATTLHSPLHMLGMHGSAYANLAMPDADVLTALGAWFNDLVTGKVDRTRRDHPFEIQPKNIKKVVQAAYSVKGDVIQTGLLSILLARKSPSERAVWRATSQGWKEKYSFV